MNDKHESRLAGGLMLGAVVGALALMLHHPTSLNGPNDGLLLDDWANSVVHGVMVVFLLVLRFAFACWARLIGRDQTPVRAGAMAFDTGMTAFVAAALINGFAMNGIGAADAAADAVRLQFMTLAALNHAFANLGMALVAVAMALWAVPMLGVRGLTRIGGCLGLVIASVAAGWAVVGHGAFGLYPATVATGLFAGWSTLIAAGMMRGELSGDRP